LAAIDALEHMDTIGHPTKSNMVHCQVVGRRETHGIRHTVIVCKRQQGDPYRSDVRLVLGSAIALSRCETDTKIRLNWYDTKWGTRCK